LSNRRIEAMIRAIAIASNGSAEQIEDSLLANEIVPLMTAFTEMLTISGLAQEGEAQGSSANAAGSASVNGVPTPERSAPSVH